MKKIILCHSGTKLQLVLHEWTTGIFPSGFSHLAADVAALARGVRRNLRAGATPAADHGVPEDRAAGGTAWIKCIDTTEMGNQLTDVSGTARARQKCFLQ